MRRSNRESTFNKSELLKSKLNSREKERARRKANKSSTTHDIIDVPLETSGNSSEEVSSNRNLSEGEVFASETEDYYWIDTSALELSGASLVSPVSPFPHPATSPDTWSVSVNRVQTGSNLADTFPVLDPLLDLDPHNLALSERSLPVVDTLSQPEHRSNSSSSSSLVTLKEKSSTMDDDQFYTYTMELDDHIVAINAAIARFNKDTVDLLDLGSYEDKLQKIYDRFDAFEKAYLLVKNKLDRRVADDAPKIQEIKVLYEGIQKRVIDNEVAVKKKLRELQSSEPTARSISSRTSSTDGHTKDKVELKIKHAIKKYKDLTKIVDDLGEVKNMSEHVIRESMVESKDWKKDLKTYRDMKEALDLEVLSTDVDEASQT